ncbi:uncharacterized protein LOC144139909 [Haemaphysalis longicornis]
MKMLKFKRTSRRAQNTRLIKEASSAMADPCAKADQLASLYERLKANNNELNKINEDLEAHIPDQGHFGDVRSWQRFWTQFSASVHNNDDLSTAYKFNYLSSLVTGAAASAISGLQATEECYKDAIEILKKRFGDDRIIVQDHLRGLLDLKPVSSSSDVLQLRHLYDRVQVHIRSLKALGTSSTTYCTMLREILLRVLPTDMVLRFHEGRKTPFSPDGASSNQHGDSSGLTASPDQELQVLLEFFDHQLMCREAVAERAEQKFHRTPEKEARKRNYPCDVPTAAALQSSVNPPQQCFFCHSGAHSSEACDAEELSLSCKKEMLAKAGRCFRCLKKGHLARDCRSQLKCGKCTRRHARSVCPADSTNDTENVTSAPKLPGRSGIHVTMEPRREGSRYAVKAQKQ